MNDSFGQTAKKFCAGCILTQFLLACDSNPPAFTEKPAEELSNEAGGNSADVSGDSYENGNPEPPGLDPNDADPMGAIMSEWRFDATSIDRAEMFITAEDQVITESFLMDRKVTDKQAFFQQVQRSSHIDLFTQGDKKANRRETFQQSEMSQAPLDIVLVVDNSGSMDEEQKNLSSKLMPLLSYVAQSDWRIGVVTTDPSDGCLRALIERQDTDPQSAFASAVMPGIGGSGNERGIYQAVEAIKATCNGGQPWVRPDSTLAVIFVTDEDNCSDGTQCSGADWESGDYLLSFLAQEREIATNARVYGLLWHPSQAGSECSTGYRQGNIYADVIEQTGGAWGSICESDYTATLQSVSQDLSVILKTQFKLSRTPLPGQTQVRVNGARFYDYTVEGSVLVFANPPEAGSAIEVSYQYQEQEPLSEFVLSKPALEESLQVFIDGKQLNDQEFRFFAESNKLQFDAAPVGDQIKVSYRENQPLKSSFELEKGIVASSIQVSVNDERLSTNLYAFQNQTATLTFQQPPAEGAAIRITYDKVVGKQLTYPLQIPDNRLDTIEVRDAETGQQLAFQLGAQSISFEIADWRLNRIIEVRYVDVSRPSDQIDLSHDVLADTVTVRGSQLGLCAPELVRLIGGSSLDFSRCGFSAYEAVQIEFDFVAEHRQSFLLDGNQVSWEKPVVVRAFVNDRVWNSFKLEDGRLVFLKELPRFAQVRIEVTQSDKL